MRASAAALAAIACFWAGCGGGGRPIKIGVLVDCSGVLAAFHDLELGSAELPLLERGARLDGAKPGDGVSAATIAGKRVELISGCAESGTYSVLIAEARRLVEDEGVDVLIGPPLESDGLVLREVARRSPSVTFVLTLSRSQETTLRRPAPNVFRFQPDGAQQTAGLGTYAYRELGWRTAVVVGEDFATSWARAAGFVAEFCALGGRIAARFFPPATAAPPGLAARIPAGADGVALVPAVSFVDWSRFIEAYARREGPVGGRLVLGPEMLILPRNRANLARVARGAVAGGSEPYRSADPLWLRLRKEYATHFPGIVEPRSAPAEFPLGLAYRNAMEAVLLALERVDGDLSHGERRFMAALARVRLQTPAGRIGLDANRQAVASAYLTRLGADDDGKPLLRMLRVVPNVEQTFNGYFTAATPPPSARRPACRRHRPPPWARAF